jgi:putative oxidoreductase
MMALYDVYARLVAHVTKADWVISTTARLVFAAVLFGYFWHSGLTKFDGPFTPSDGAFAQIFPMAFEAAGYDATQLTLFHKAVALMGGWAELILPTLIVFGCMTRLAALGMIGFVLVQSLTDVFGHKVDPSTLGHWFDATADAAILDQRAFWIVVLMALVIKGGGPLALDRFARQ